jgi:hypothetical protein
MFPTKIYVSYNLNNDDGTYMHVIYQFSIQCLMTHTCDTTLEYFAKHLFLEVINN